MKKKIIIILGVVVLAVIVFVNLKSANGKIVAVNVEKAAKKNLVEKVSATGQIKPKKNINISTDVAGKILKILVREGDTVKKGQLLLKIDSTQYESYAERDREVIGSSQADLISQEASQKKARQYYERRKQLFEEGLISREQFDEAKIQVEIAQANEKSTYHRIEQARASLKSSSDAIKKTYIVSPIDGIVTSLKVEEGEVAIIGTMNNPGTVLLTIADLSVMESEVLVDETDVVKVKVGEKAEVRVDALPGVIIAGQVTEVGNSAIVSSTVTTTTTGESKDFKTVITLNSPPQTLKPGFSATADIIIAERKQVLAVPIAAVVYQEVETQDKEKKNEGQEKEGIFIVRDGRCRFIEIEKGISGDMYIEVTRGLKENDPVITGPFVNLKKLKDGDRIKVIEEKK